MNDSLTSHPCLLKQVQCHPYPLLFATISGAHLYGFPSPDSDFDLRGVHVLPLRQVVGLGKRDETVEKSGVHDGMEIDLVTHDAEKFFKLMLKRNGYVLEQLLSPWVVQSSPEHEELKSLAIGCITRHHACHYLGFADTQWRLFQKEDPPRVKPLLYVYRVLLTGVHLMESGTIEANLNVLNDEYQLPYIPDLIARKTTGKEKEELAHADMEFHSKEFARLVSRLQQSYADCHLPEQPSCMRELDDLLVRVRLAAIDSVRGDS